MARDESGIAIRRIIEPSFIKFGFFKLILLGNVANKAFLTLFVDFI